MPPPGRPRVNRLVPYRQPPQRRMKVARVSDDSREHRRAARRKTLKAGKIVLSDWSVIDCTVRDMSETGARLEFGAVAVLPPEFRLLIVSSNQLIPARLSWQRGATAGVQFTGSAQDAPPRRW